MCALTLIFDSALKRIEIFHIDAASLAEQHDQDREADRGFRRGNRQDEKHEDLAAEVPLKRENATKLKFTASSMSSMHIRRTMTFLRFRNTPATAMANRMPESASTWVS